MLRFALIGLLVVMHPLAAAEPDSRWPDFGLERGDSGAVVQSGSSEYFQGFEAPCFGAPYSPAAGDDWIRFYSEVVRVPSGSGGIASRSGLNHAELRPPLPGAPASNTGAFTRLGGYASTFDGGFVVEIDIYLDLSDPQVQSGVNADYGFDVASAVNNQAGGHRRDFVFHTASNTAGQILVGSSNTTNFAVRGDLASGPHFVVASSGWYTFQWTYRDAGDGTLAVDTNLLSSAGATLWTRTLNNPADVIATQIGGNRYLWFTFLESDRVAIDNSRINSGIVSATYASNPLPGTTINAGTASVGSPAAGANLQILSQGTLRLEICSCSISGAAASDFSISGCPALIEPGSSQNFAIGCTPSAAGARSASLSVVTNDSAGGTTFTYALTCTGSFVAPPPPPPQFIPTQSAAAAVMLAALLALLGVVAMRRTQ